MHTQLCFHLLSLFYYLFRSTDNSFHSAIRLFNIQLRIRVHVQRCHTQNTWSNMLWFLSCQWMGFHLPLRFLWCLLYDSVSSVGLVISPINSSGWNGWGTLHISGDSHFKRHCVNPVWQNERNAYILSTLQNRTEQNSDFHGSSDIHFLHRGRVEQ